MGMVRAADSLFKCLYTILCVLWGKNCPTLAHVTDFSILSPSLYLWTVLARQFKYIKQMDNDYWGRVGL